MLEILYATGLRVGELCSLRLDHVDLAGCLVRVVGKGGKERVVPFGSKAAAALRAWLQASAGLRGQGRTGEAIFSTCAAGR